MSCPLLHNPFRHLCFFTLVQSPQSLSSAARFQFIGGRRLLKSNFGRISTLTSMSHRPNFQSGRRGGGGRGGGGRGRGRGGGGRGGGCEQRWWDPVWRAERLRQQATEIEVMDQNEWWGKIEHLKQGGEQEMIIRRKFSRDDQQILADMAYQLGLHFHAYHKGKAMVVSKVPLPNYRADLDEQHGSTTKEIKISTEIERRVGNLLNSSNGTTSGVNNSSLSSETVTLQSKSSEISRSASQLEIDSAFEEFNVQLKQKQEKMRESDGVKAMLEFREKLPASKVKSDFLKAVAENQVLIVSGETGCGKTTQLPQFILEEEISSLRGAKCSMICTQPRRISAISVAARISAERGEKLGDTVGYQIRLESKRSSQTRLLFCTTGVLLRQMVQDPNLTGITHLLVDEIHERGMNEDFLLIILQDILPRRPDLRLILMSATINADLFSKYFGNAPTVHIPGLTFPVKEFYLEDVLEKTRYIIKSDSDSFPGNSRGRRRQQESKKDPLTELYEEADIDVLYNGYCANTRRSLEAWSDSPLDLGLVESTIEHICRHEGSGAILVFLTGWDDISKLLDKLKANNIVGDPNKFLVIPLHGSMPTINQREIFDRPPLNVRKIVLATNIAESSITIDDVVYVVDCGKAKETSYDALNKLACLLPSWISKASAHQRRGRAGRVQPGFCYRLYPKLIHDAMPQYQLPEMLRTPLQELCLHIKSLQLGGISTFLSKALQPPDPLAVENAIELLKTIGALDDQEGLTPLGQTSRVPFVIIPKDFIESQRDKSIHQLTGRHLSTLPLDPNIGKMLLMGSVFQCLNPALTIAAALAYRQPFVLPINRKEEADEAKRSFAGDSCSDHIALLKAFEGWKDAKRNRNDRSFCWENFLSPVTMQMMDDMRMQFLDLLSGIGFVNKSRGPEAYNQYSDDLEMVCAILCAGLYPKVVQCKRRGKRTALYSKEVGKVGIHPASVNASVHLFPLPYMVYSEMVKTSSIYLRDSTNISDYALLMFGGNLIPSKTGDGIEMLGGYLHFSASKTVLDLIQKLRGELDKLLTRKIEEPGLDVTVEGKGVVSAVIELLHSQNLRYR
ncbi:hypothetical protein CASFOL_009457 [Castilleja foliolosa]|uniref:RNA helicase n=1 Tax=Castilleja foliolosa TaxID=1961234 RepID=A0ABD3DXE0_9LAMI